MNCGEIMLSLFDDYCIHQSPAPIRQPETSDQNAYDRYFANGFARDGRYYFAIALGRYANRGVMDAEITFLIGGVHHSFFASRGDPEEPSHMKLGEFELKIDDPMRVMTVSLAPNDSGLSCRLRWQSRSAPLEEARHTMRSNGRIVNDATRMTQFGCWEGWFEIDGVRIEVRPEHCPGVKDRSWGLRQGSNQSGGRPEPRQTLFWNWVPLNFGDFCVHSLRVEDANGRVALQDSLLAPMYTSEQLIPIHETTLSRFDIWAHDYKILQHTGQIVGGTITLGDQEKPAQQRKIEIGPPLLTAWPTSVGYGHPKWGHGLWHGELATAHERWNVADVDFSKSRFALMHQIVNVTCDGRQGIGFVEQMIVGPYPRYGLIGQSDAV
jgi:hypothetical protein